MRSSYALFLCALFVRSFYVHFYCALWIRSLYALFVFAFFMCPFYALFLCTIFMCTFHRRLEILRMHKKCYCAKTNMPDNKMGEVLKRLGVSDHRARFVEEKISTDTVCYLSIKDFLKLGLTNRNAIMSLRIECSNFGLCTLQRAVGTNLYLSLSNL